MAQPRRPRLSEAGLCVLSVFVADPGNEQYGFELSRLAGLKSGTIYPMLSRFEDYGWLESGWEDIDESEAKRPARRYYRITGSGVEAYQDAIEKLYQPRSTRPSWRPLEA